VVTLALISQNFKNDTQGNNLSVIPVVIVAELEDDKYNLLDSFSTSNLILQDQDDNSIETKEILQNISSVKNSIDYEQKNIKVNTFRFSLYNYYDAVTKLTNSVSFNDLNSLIGKYVILYYKTPTCSKINLNKNIQELSNDDCSIMFYGIVNRISQSGDKISIQAEDFTQDYIKDKQLPATKLADLDEKIKDGISDLDESKPVPMVYGKVDKAPSVVYQTNLENNDGYKSLGMIHDSQPVSSVFRTSKDTGTYTNPFPYLYLTDDDDYVVFPYEVYFNPSKGESNFVNPQTFLFESANIIPELEHTHATPILCMGYTFPNNVLVDLSGDNTISSLKDAISDVNQNPNSDILFSNYGYDKKWYRDDDAYAENHNPTELFNVETITYPSSTAEGKGRWILCKLDKTKKIYRFNGYVKLFAGLDESGNPIQNTNTERVYLYLNPLNVDYLKELLDNETSESDLATLLTQDTETGSSDVSLMPSYNSKTARNRIFKEYRDSNGRFDHTETKNNFDGMVETDLALFYENYQGNTEQSLGMQLANFSFIYFVEKSNYESETFYASITGRKDYSSTENITNLTQLQEEINVTPNEAALGLDNTLPNFDELINEWDLYFDQMYHNFSNKGEANTFLNIMFFIDSGNSYDFGVVDNFDYGTAFQYLVSDFPYKRTSESDDSKFSQSNQVIANILHGLVKKLYRNIYENVVFNQLKEESLDLIKTLPNGEYTANLFSQYELGENNYVQFMRKIFDTSLNNSWGNDYPVNAYEEYLETFYNNINEYESYRRLLITSIFKYLYQQDIEVDNLGLQLPEWDLGVDLNTNESIDIWIDNLTPYLDELINVINKDICDVESHIENGEVQAGNRLELYLWNENPNENGQTTPHITQLWKHINYDSIKTEFFTNPNVVFETNGIVEKPTDIFINLLSRELNYGLGDNVLDTNFFDHNLIEESRAVYNGWKMGFCIDDSVEAKNLLQDISKETQSFFSFTQEGNFGLITIKNNYTEDDIDYVIDETDVLNYSISRTKRENVIIRNKCFYRYDNGLDKYTFDTGELNINTLLDYNGEQYYNINEDTAFSEKQLRYHTDTATAKKFQEFDLLNNCNQHLLINMDLPLSYTIKCGDILHIPLLNDTKAFGIDYSKAEMLNGQPIYPLWIVTATDYSLDRIRVSAYQLHYLGTDGVHGFGENYDVIANLRMFNTTYPSIRNYNYLPLSERNQFVNYVQGQEIPYGDLNQDGVINITDVIGLVNMIINNEYSDIADVNNSESLNVTDVIALVNTIIE
jgi:hypothetical protein